MYAQAQETTDNAGVLSKDEIDTQGSTLNNPVGNALEAQKKESGPLDKFIRANFERAVISDSMPSSED